MKQHYIILCSLFLFHLTVPAQLVINEVQVSNITSHADQDGDYEDWFEVYNAGSTTINTAGYTVSDNNGNVGKWELPARNIAPGEHLLIWASGKDMGGGNSHYETAFQHSTFWKYKVPTSEPPSNWRDLSFNATPWNGGGGGIGYADLDDVTIVGSCFSVFMRKTFTLSNIAAIRQIVLHMDFDDGFAAYLNGVEIARENLGQYGVPAPYTTAASSSHEALGLTGAANIGAYVVPEEIWMGLLVTGTNVLAVQTHNLTFWDGDLTSKPSLSFMFDSPTTQFPAPPSWMNLIPELHTNFKLDTGEDLVIADPLGNIVDEIIIPPTVLGDAYARETSGSANWCYTESPTPETNNSGSICATGYEPKPIFSIESGKYPSAQTVSITTTSATAQIRYTLDGSIPIATSTLYTGPLAINNSVTVSAICFSTGGLLASHVEKNTYMINESNLSLPVISISTNSENLYDFNTGIYVFGPEDYTPYVPHWGANFWEDWEREAYIEYFDVTGQKQFEGGAGIKIHGGWSRVNAQKSFRIIMRDDYGFDEIDYPLIHDKNFITTWKSFNLRNGGNDYWGPRFHDALMQRVMRTTHADYMAYTPVLSFLNGEYFGMYEMREHLNENYCAANTGIDPDNATVISYSYQGFKVLNGNPDPFFDMYNYITGTSPADANYFNTAFSMMDLENYTDYIIGETYWCNGDWSNGWINNTKFWHDDTPGGKWRFMFMDLDFGMGLAGNAPTDDYINTAGDEGYYTDMMFADLITNTEFKNYFINRNADLINTVFQQENVSTMAYEMQAEIEDAFSRHCTNWGTDCGSIDWAVEQRLDWNEARVQGARDVVETHFNLPGQVDVTLQTVPAGAGYIKISTITPTDLPWSAVYFQGVPVTVTAIANPGYAFVNWNANAFISNVNASSATNTFSSDITFTANFSGGPIAPDIVVTEINYNSDPSRPEGDWVELYNNTNVAIELSDWIFRDQNVFNEYRFPVGTFIPALSYLVLSEDLVKFSEEHPAVTNVMGEFDFDLSNSGENITLLTLSGALVFNFEYNDASEWPQTPDGHGRSLERKIPFTVASQGSSWFDGCMGGSPGAAYVQCNENPVVSEINYKSLTTQNAGDWIELHNKISDAVYIGGWKLEDDNGNSYTIPPGSVLAGDSHIVLYQDLALFTAQFPTTINIMGPFVFGFSGDGDVIRVLDENGRLFTSVAYNDTAPWPLTPDGGGYTLELSNENGNLNDGSNWFAGCPEGSPGTAYDPGCTACTDFGCNDPVACNYISSAVCDDGSCTYPGCINVNACNYNSSAGCDDGSCTYNTFYADGDDDGFGDAANSIQSSCIVPPGYVNNNTDCNDADSSVHPGAPGTAMDIDNNCNGAIDPSEAAPCLGDFNDDGTINITDMLLFMGDFGCEGICAGDLDGNGTVNTGDLLFFMGVFGGVCGG